MSTKKPRTNSTAATTTAIAHPTITRAQAQEMLKTRAIERFQDAKTRQQDGIATFEAEHGRADRIDMSLLREVQHLQMRFAAIAARQSRHGYGQEPKTNKFVKSLGDIIGEVTVHLATDNALELFAPINEQEYLGYGSGNGTLGQKGYDPSILEGYNIIDDPKPTKPLAPTDEDDEVCLHTTIEPDEDDATRGVCADCSAEFEIPTSTIAAA